MVAYLLSELLEVGTTYRHSAARTLDSTNFAVVPRWKTSDGSTTFSLGFEAWILLQVSGLGAVDWGRYESRRLGSTLQIFHRIVLYIEQPDFILYKIPCRVHAFCACARKGLANLACRPDLTWPGRWSELFCWRLPDFCAVVCGSWPSFRHVCQTVGSRWCVFKSRENNGHSADH